jgi:tripartite-type tricarboxylate transporter receptor subunit TctC
MAGIRARHVPYKGAGPELIDVMNGQVDYAIEVVAATVGHVRAGRLRALGVSTARRATALMEVPTLQQAADLPDYDMGVWIGLAAPSSLPPEVHGRLSREMRKAMASKDLRNRLMGAGLDPVSSTPEEMQTFLRSEQERYAAVIHSANIRLDP